MQTKAKTRFRQALTADIPQIQVVRNSVLENILSDPSRVTDAMCEEMISSRGKGWVCEANGQVVGFSIVDLQENNVWALFVHPEHEGSGIGKKLHDQMVDWYFAQTSEKLWLSTEPDTRAESFYRKSGWIAMGTHGEGEIKFELTQSRWQDRNLCE